MTGKISRKFRIHTAKQFYEQFDEAAPSRIYLFIGKPTGWTDDLDPPDPLDKVEVTDYDIWTNMLALKKIEPTDVTLAARRVDWESGETFGMYESNAELTTTTDFYVMTDSYQVYKCLYNNNGAVSTVKPTGISTSAFTTADGYVWKYMYTISASDALKFLTSLYIPVKKLASDDDSAQWDVQQAAVNGSIEIVKVANSGSSYVTHTGTVTAANSSTVALGASASAVDNYYNYSSVYISGGLGSGQIRKIVDYTGSTKRARLLSNWSVTPNTSSTYIVSPTVTISGDGVNATAYSTVSGGAIDKIYVTATGQSYSYANTTFSSNTGSGARGTPELSPFGGHGSDAVKEIFGHNIIMNVKLTGDESNTFMTQNEYRILGLVLDPLTSAGATANASVYNQTTRITLTSTSGTFAKDEVVTGGTSGTTGNVVEYGSNTVLMITGNRKSFTNTEIITGGTSGASATIDGITAPDIKKFYGDILYFEHRTPIARDDTQSEDIKIVLRF